PALVRHARPGGRALAAMLLVLGAGLALYARAGSHLFDSLRVYAEHWRYNDFAFAWLRGHVDDPLRARRIAAAATCVVVGVTALGARTVAGGAVAALGATLLVTPTVHAWYLLWPLVLVPLCPSRAVLAWSATIPLAYHFAYPALGQAVIPD